MDQVGSEVITEFRPDLVSDACLAPPVDEIPLADIDVPCTASAQRVIERCRTYVECTSALESDLTDHLARAFWNTPECTVAKLMNEDGVLSAEFIASLEAMLGATYGIAPNGESCSANLRLERVIIRAKREAYRRRHMEASSMHLLWGLLRERSGPAIYEWEQAATAENAD